MSVILWALIAAGAGYTLAALLDRRPRWVGAAVAFLTVLAGYAGYAYGEWVLGW